LRQVIHFAGVRRFGEAQLYGEHLVNVVAKEQRP